jgi:hypothetical protein
VTPVAGRPRRQYLRLLDRQRQGHDPRLRQGPDGTETLVLKNVAKADLDAGDFLFGMQ